MLKGGVRMNGKRSSEILLDLMRRSQKASSPEKCVDTEGEQDEVVFREYLEALSQRHQGAQNGAIGGAIGSASLVKFIDSLLCEAKRDPSMPIAPERVRLLRNISQSAKYWK